MSEPSASTDTDTEIELEEEIPSLGGDVFPPGALISGKYEVVRRLGRGGAGTVYESKHVTIGHRVAIKIVNADRAHRPETLARFHREAKLCGTIRHPNVGQVFDVGALEDGKPFMVMELHEGRSLADVLEESVLPIAAILEIALQLLSGLAAVHDAGVVHRDVKPDNAMLVRGLNGEIVLKLVDFGIAKVVHTDIGERALTRQDSLIGSPDYMAPEQLRGLPIDARTDLYAVGVLLYEAVTGTTPFDAENVSDLLAAILRDPVTPPAELRPDCPPELDALIMKALTRDPAQRFQSASELSRGIEQVRVALRYSSDSGMARLQQPLPRRATSNKTTRARGRRALTLPSIGAPAPAAEEHAMATTAEVTLEQSWTSGLRPATKRIAAAALIGVLIVFALVVVRSDSSEQRAGRVRETVASATPLQEPRVSAPPAPSAPPVQAIQHAEPIEVEPSAAEPEPSSPKPALRRKSAREHAPQPEPQAAEATPSASSTQELLREATSAFVLGQLPRARALYQQVLDRQPRQAEAWRGLGLAAARMGQSDDARRAFERYLALRPNAADAERIREQLDKLR